jgi:hypothetical protein
MPSASSCQNQGGANLNLLIKLNKNKKEMSWISLSQSSQSKWFSARFGCHNTILKYGMKRSEHLYH